MSILLRKTESAPLKINQLFILPEYQNRGLGRASMTVLIERSHSLKLPLRLRVLKMNPRAVEFYQRFNFEITGETETHLLMERPLQH